MNEKLKYNITPEELLKNQGYKYSIKGQWLSVKYCPFCTGGKTKQQYTFGIHRFDYNYNCLRTTCGQASSFWNLLIHFGLDPKEYIDKTQPSHKNPHVTKKPGYIYRRQT